MSWDRTSHLELGKYMTVNWGILKYLSFLIQHMKQDRVWEGILVLNLALSKKNLEKTYLFILNQLNGRIVLFKWIKNDVNRFK